MRSAVAGLMPAWWRHYPRHWLGGDIAAGVMVALLLIPQGLAYALVAGLPVQAGLYASLLPLVLYGLIGRSHAQSVGPMAVTSLLVAATLGRLVPPGSDAYLLAAMWLAILSGGWLLLFGSLRLGLLADMLSEPVLAGFTSASALLIVVSQLGPLAGVRAGGASLPEMVAALMAHLPHAVTVAGWLGGAAVVVLVLARWGLPTLLARAGVPMALARQLTRVVPVGVLVASLYWLPSQPWQALVPQVGTVPSGLPALAWPATPAGGLAPLVLPAFFIALINYVQSLSVAQLLAAPRREVIDPDRELLALGVCNVGAGLCGGFPVTGGLTRSVVNAEAGANSQLASWLTAGLMVAMLLAGGQWLAGLPLPVLAAIIVVAVAPQITLAPLRAAWRADRADAVAFAVTFLLVLALGVDSGIAAGVVISLLAWLFQSSRPHMAELGLLPGGNHLRNISRHAAQTLPGVMLLRVDESLYFGNARHVRAALLARLASRPEVHTLVLIMSAVNRIDTTGLAMLARLDDTLAAQGICLHLAEVKGPVMDTFRRDGLASRFAGRTHLSALAAWQALCPPPDFHI